LYSRMNLDIAQRDVIWTSLLNGFAGPLIFVPLTTTAMGTLSLEQMGQGTGIFNLMRNIGASVGIAAVTTLLTRGTQAHQARLVAHLTPYDPAYLQWLDAPGAQLAPQVGAPAAGSAALGLLYRTLVRQATLLSFLDTFRLLALLALACLPLVLLFRRVRARPTPAVEGASRLIRARGLMSGPAILLEAPAGSKAPPPGARPAHRRGGPHPRYAQASFLVSVIRGLARASASQRRQGCVGVIS